MRGRISGPVEAPEKQNARASAAGTTCLAGRHSLPGSRCHPAAASFSRRRKIIRAGRRASLRPPSVPAGLRSAAVFLALMLSWATAWAAEFRANMTVAQTQETMSLNRGSQQAVSFDDAGNVVIVWTSGAQDSAASKGVYARRFAPDGAALTGEILVNATTSGDQSQASVASDDSGNFVVTWTSDGQDGSGTGVYLRRFAANGTALTGEIAVNTTTNGAQQNSVIALNRASGGFVVAWQGQGTGDSAGIFFRRFAANGTALDGTEQLANSVDSGLEENPSIAISATGDFVIAYDVILDIYGDAE